MSKAGKIRVDLTANIKGDLFTKSIYCSSDITDIKAILKEFDKAGRGFLDRLEPEEV